MHMKKWFLFALVVVLALGALALTGCRGDDAGTDDGAATTGDSDTVFFGGTLAMTGDNAPFDSMGIRGMELAVDKLNADGGINGKKVVFKNLDCQSDPAVSIEVAKQLLDEGADVIITTSDFDFGGPAAKVAGEQGKIGINASASDPGYGSKKLGPYAFTMSIWNTTMGAAAAEVAYLDDGNRSVWCITDPFISYTESLTRYFIETFEHYGGKVVDTTTVVHNNPDTAALLATWKAFGNDTPDCIWVSGYPDTLGPIIKEFRAAGITEPIYGGDVMEDPEVWDVWGAGATNVTWAGHSFLSEEAVPTLAEYKELYEAKYGEELDAPWSMGGWDVIMVLAEAIEATGSLKGEDIAKYMTTNRFTVKTGGPTGVTWSSAEEGHEPDKAACMVNLVDGVPKFLGWKIPDYLPAP